jgi:phytoene dehydrogenase-like protein
MADSTHDAVVVGAGHNGLVAAVYLARAGLDVAVLEQNERVGGAVMSAEVTRPGFVHDLFATNQNLFLGSPAFAELGEDLARHGLSFATTDHPYANAYPGGRSLRVYQDPARTREALAAHSPGDAAGWDALFALYERFAPTLFEVYGARLPSRDAARWLGRSARGLGPQGLAELGQLVMSSTRMLGDAWFETPEAKAMAAAWGMHLDFGPDVAMGALFPFLELFTDMANGMSVVEGGASRLPEALAALAAEAGASVRTGARVERIVTEGGRAVAAELASGERVGARVAVVANLTPGVLQRLVELPGAYGAAARRYAYGPGTMMIHAALDAPLPWAAGEELQKFGYIHIGPYVDEMAATYTEAMNGLLPRSPLLVAGQTTAIDPSRAPEGGHILWLQVRMLPAEIRGDAGHSIAERSWPEANEAYAERVLDKLAEYAPGFRDHILDWTIWGPADLERHDPNLVGGDSVGGSHQLAQNALFRPAPGWSGYRTPIDKLYVVGAGTWPGAGVNAISGRLAAQLITEEKSGKGARIAAAAAGGAAALALAIRAARR